MKVQNYGHSFRQHSKRWLVQPSSLLVKQIKGELPSCNQDCARWKLDSYGNVVWFIVRWKVGHCLIRVESPKLRRRTPIRSVSRYLFNFMESSPCLHRSSEWNVLMELLYNCPCNRGERLSLPIMATMYAIIPYSNSAKFSLLSYSRDSRLGRSLS